MYTASSGVQVKVVVIVVIVKVGSAKPKIA